MSLALRMLRALNIDFGLFLSDLASEAGISTNKNYAKSPLLDVGTLENESVQMAFGNLFRSARQKMGITQQDVADRIDYHIRNLTKIENGLQEPRIMRAISLISATGYDVGSFFKQLESVYIDVDIDT